MLELYGQLNLNNNTIKNMVLDNSDSLPNGINFQLYGNSANHKIYAFINGQWVSIMVTGAIGAPQGSVLFGDIDGTVTYNQSKIVWDNSSYYLGIGTNIPRSTLDIHGSVASIANTVTTNTTLTDAHHVLLCDAQSGGFTVTAPMTNVEGREYFIQKIDNSANEIIIDLTASQYNLTMPNHSVLIKFFTSKWYMLFDSMGGKNMPIKTVTASSYSVGNQDSTIMCDAISNSITINLPVASQNKGRVLNISKIDLSQNTVTIAGYQNELIDDMNLFVINQQWNSYTLHCTGAFWKII